MQTFKFLILTVFSISTLLANAQTTKETFKVWGNCGMCKATIEKAAKGAGAATASWDVGTKNLMVSYNSANSSLSAIEAKIASAGYDTKNKTAVTEAYNKLHGCCKYERKEGSTSAASCCSSGASCCTAGASCCASSKVITPVATSAKDCCIAGAACCGTGKDCCTKETADANTSVKSCCTTGAACCDTAKDCCSKASSSSALIKDCCVTGAECCKAGADCCNKEIKSSAAVIKTCCAAGAECCGDSKACCTKASISA